MLEKEVKWRTETRALSQMENQIDDLDPQIKGLATLRTNQRSSRCKESEQEYKNRDEEWESLFSHLAGGSIDNGV